MTTTRKKKTTITTRSVLFKRGNYSMLRPLTIVNAAGPAGLSTLQLLDEIGSRATYTQNVITKAAKQGLIDRKQGEQPGPGQFRPVLNVITDKGKQLLQSR
jgi:DNA-binding MarR family transcriptional regulator